MEETISVIKSCVVSRKGGMPLVELNGDYEELVGEPIPFKRLGFQSLGKFLSSIPEIRAIRSEAGLITLTLEDEKVAHIAALISRQKEAQMKRKKVSPKLSKTKMREVNGRYGTQRYPNRYYDKENYDDASRTRSTKYVHTSNSWNDNRPMYNYAPRRTPFYSSTENEYSSRNTRYAARNSYQPSRTYSYQPRNADHYEQNRFYEEDTQSSQCDDEDDDSDYYDRPCERMASVVNNMLRVTVQNTRLMEEDTSDSLSTSLSLSEDLAYRNFLASRHENLEDFQTLIEPTLFGHQMIGDDFFLDLANKSPETSQDRRNGPQSSNLCIAGQRIRDCYRRILRRSVIGEHLILMLGAVDILEGVDLSDMKSDMLDLLDILMPQVKSVIIVTIPPLVNMCHIKRKWFALCSFNKWLTQLDTGDWCRVVDIWTLFRGRRTKMYDYFEDSPKKVAGSSACVVLWNRWGRKTVLEYLRRKLF